MPPAYPALIAQVIEFGSVVTPKPLKLPCGLNWEPVPWLDVSRFPMPMMVTSRLNPHSFGHSMGNGVEICVEVWVRDRDNPDREISVRFNQIFDPYWLECQGPERILYEMLRTVVLHELDECFLVEGVRVNDPHKINVTSSAGRTG